MNMTLEQERRIFDSMKTLAPVAHIATMVSICGWCPGAAMRTRALAAEGVVVSHGMCPACSEKMLAQIGEGR